MSKAASRLKNIKKSVEKVIHGPTLKTNIKAGSAVAGPPLGPQLGQVSYVPYIGSISTVDLILINILMGQLIMSILICWWVFLSNCQL